MAEKKGLAVKLMETMSEMSTLGQKVAALLKDANIEEAASALKALKGRVDEIISEYVPGEDSAQTHQHLVNVSKHLDNCIAELSSAKG